MGIDGFAMIGINVADFESMDMTSQSSYRHTYGLSCNCFLFRALQSALYPYPILGKTTLYLPIFVLFSGV